MDKNRAEEIVEEALDERGFYEAELTESFEEIGMDDLEVEEFLDEIQDTIGEEIEDAEKEKFETPGDVAAYLKKNVVEIDEEELDLD